MGTAKSYPISPPILQLLDPKLQAGFWGPAWQSEMCLGAEFCGCLGLVPALGKGSCGRWRRKANGGFPQHASPDMGTVMSEFRDYERQPRVLKILLAGSAVVIGARGMKPNHIFKNLVF